jgi:DNA-binding XRE family transcriptional regulator
LTYKGARVNNEFTLTQASHALGICTTTLVSYEKGYTKPNSEMLRKMADLYECEVSDFKEVVAG